MTVPEPAMFSSRGVTVWVARWARLRALAILAIAAGRGEEPVAPGLKNKKKISYLGFMWGFVGVPGKEVGDGLEVIESDAECFAAVKVFEEAVVRLFRFVRVLLG